MAYGPLISKILFSFILSSTVLYRYGNWLRHHIVVTFVVLLAWFFSFLIMFALPLDIVSTVFRQCVQQGVNLNATLVNTTLSTKSECEEPWSHVPDEVFPNLWRTVYWSTQCLTWLFMPMMQSYIKAGDFTVKGKLKFALINNAIYYGSYLFIVGILLIYLATQPGIDIFQWSKLKAIASSASNTWGLFLLVLLLGYALVAVPRNLWNNSNQSYILNHAYFKAAKLSVDKIEAEETVDDVLESLHAISLTIRVGHPLHQHYETIAGKIPIELKERMNRRQINEETGDLPTEKSLIRLHSQVIKSLQVLQRTETQWNILVEDIFEMEDTLRNLNSRDRSFKRTFERPRNIFQRVCYNATIEWYWRCIFASYTKKFVAVLAGTLSIVVVWSELTFFNKEPVLSIFANIVNVAKEDYDYTTIEIMSTVVILYLGYCAFSTVLKIKFFNLYYLAPHHQTNEYSLIFSGMMLSRLTPPLCLNFLGLIHMDSHIIREQVQETHYTQIMGHMDVIKIISDGFNIYFPMAIMFFCVATYFKLGSRMLSAIGFHQFIGDDEITTDLVNEGRDLIKREKRRRQRAEDAQNRRKDFQERFANSGRYRSRGNTDTIRTNKRSEEMSEVRRHSSNETAVVDTSLPSSKSNDLADDIDARFGISTRNTINERYDSANELDDQLNQFGSRVGGLPPRGIFDDV